MKLKKLIGIISYLPDDEKIRKLRFELLLWLLQSCYRFNCDILIVAQNYHEEELEKLRNKVILDINDKLGITGARKRLREVFLSLDYDYLIMLDDDCDIRASDKGIQAYLSEIDEHPDSVLEFRGSLLKLYAISKSVYKEVDFRDDISAEAGTGFEDTIFVHDVRKKFPDKVRAFRCRYYGINEISKYTADPLSTWYTDQDLPEMLKKTKSIVADNVNNL